MWVDLGRGPPPRAQMVFFGDSDQATDIQWKIADPGAQQLPVYSLFASGHWLDRPSGPLHPVGEIEGSYVYSPWYAHSPFRGVCYQGTADQWAGKASAQDPIPPRAACCQPPWQTAGGVVTPGSATVWGVILLALIWDLSTGLMVDTNVVHVTSDLTTGATAEEISAGHIQVRNLAASPSQMGAVDNLAQSFGGAKTFLAEVTIDNADPGLTLSHVGATGVVGRLHMGGGEFGGGTYATTLDNFDGTDRVEILIDAESGGWFFDGSSAAVRNLYVRDLVGNLRSGFSGTSGPLTFVAGWCVSTGGAASPGVTYSATNGSGGSLGAGSAVTQSSGGGAIVAGQAVPGQAAVGLVTSTTGPGSAGLVQTSGTLTLPDWSGVVGTGSLSPRATYYLSATPGQLTNTPPSLAGQIVQQVGVAVEPQTMEIDLGNAILL